MDYTRGLNLRFENVALNAIKAAVMNNGMIVRNVARGRGRHGSGIEIFKVQLKDVTEAQIRKECDTQITVNAIKKVLTDCDINFLDVKFALVWEQWCFVIDRKQ